MIDLDAIQQDHLVLTEILQARQTVTTETLPAGVRILWGVYLMILEDALKTLKSLIDYIEKR